MTQSVSFKIFLALWNRAQGVSTPAIHFRMAGWLEGAWQGNRPRLLLQAFRSSGKSTITGLFAAWLLYQRADLRILVLAADMLLARKMVRNVKRIIERHPLTAHLKPERLDQWGADRFTVRRERELRDPSMLARGIGANMTGSRADIIICDDVEVPKTCETAEKRDNLRERLAEIDFVLTPGGTVLYIGTPHTWYTIYAPEARSEIGEDAPFLDNYQRLTIPIVDEVGASAWPERYSPEDIAHMKRAAGPNKFASQMLLRAVNITEGRLDPAALQWYEGRIERSAELNGLYLNGKRLISCSAWWDPAFGAGKNGDGSVFAVVFTDEDNNCHLHRVEYVTADPRDAVPEAEQQCRKVAFIAQLLHVPCITVETNGIGQFLPNILRRELSRNRVPCAVRETASTRPKDIRILEAFDAVLAARALYVHENVRKTAFMREMQEWRPGQKGRGHDDGLDAVAGALSLTPMRLSYERFGGRQSWTGSGKNHTAKTEFEV